MKYHLATIQGEIAACNDVPLAMRELFQKFLDEKKRKKNDRNDCMMKTESSSDRKEE